MSVVAAASNAARMVRAGGGFVTEADPPIMTGQVQLVDVPDPDLAILRLATARDELMTLARAATPRLLERGGGAQDVSARVLSRPGDPDGGMVVVHVDVDCCDAMGANLVNTIAERLSPRTTPRRPG